MKNEIPNVTFNKSKTIITYDLSPCNISSQNICDQDSRLFNTVSIENDGIYQLPNTTIITKLSIKEAVNAFRKAVSDIDSNVKITKLFAVVIENQKGYVENN